MCVLKRNKHNSMPTIRQIIAAIEEFAPLALQESYDNAGLQVGDASLAATGVLLCVDVTEAVVDEAIERGCNLIVAHHPLLFRPLKRITGSNYIERVVMKALRNDVAIYAAHTNLDAVAVNHRWAQMLGLTDVEVLQPTADMLYKLVVYVPVAHADAVCRALYDAGAGSIGDYDCCSFTSQGVGTFRAGENTQPYCGEKGVLHHEPESRVEVVLPRYLKSRVVRALLAAHPYEEPAYDIIPIANDYSRAGMGVVGNLPQPIEATELLLQVKDRLRCGAIRHNAAAGTLVKRVALCGGSGSSLIGNAVAAGADIFITGEIGYHPFFGYENKLVLAETGHYESEQHTKEIFYEVITKKIPNFAPYYAKVETNPIKYL